MLSGKAAMQMMLGHGRIVPERIASVGIPSSALLLGMQTAAPANSCEYESRLGGLKHQLIWE